MSEAGHVIVLHRFDVAAERVFDACLDPAWVGRWMFVPEVDERVVRLALEARVGGRFAFVVARAGGEVHYEGEYLEIDRPRLLVFSWATRDCPSRTRRVIIEITPRDRGCEVKLTHVMGGSWLAEVDRAASMWARMLEALEWAIAQEEKAQRT